MANFALSANVIRARSKAHIIDNLATNPGLRVDRHNVGDGHPLHLAKDKSRMGVFQKWKAELLLDYQGTEAIDRRQGQQPVYSKEQVVNGLAYALETERELRSLYWGAHEKSDESGVFNAVASMESAFSKAASLQVEDIIRIKPGPTLVSAMLRRGLRIGDIERVNQFSADFLDGRDGLRALKPGKDPSRIAIRSLEHRLQIGEAVIWDDAVPSNLPPLAPRPFKGFYSVDTARFQGYWAVRCVSIGINIGPSEIRSTEGGPLRLLPRLLSLNSTEFESFSRYALQGQGITPELLENAKYSFHMLSSPEEKFALTNYAVIRFKNKGRNFVLQLEESGASPKFNLAYDVSGQIMQR